MLCFLAITELVSNVSMKKIIHSNDISEYTMQS